ncbi:MAG: hypothetical protein IJN77_07945 [Oscillospiraceae bacterium]|nr:hypothetical protein [Oscillospiraceae bacterium]MBQ6850953.1 hypothetical protein [Oscillospiraceae bacterium]
MGLFNKKNKLFGNRISPACEYCQFGTRSRDNAMILCSKKGVVSPFYSCNKYVYMPTKRIPKRRPNLPNYSVEDFKL